MAPRTQQASKRAATMQQQGNTADGSSQVHIDHNCVRENAVLDTKKNLNL